MQAAQLCLQLVPVLQANPASVHPICVAIEAQLAQRGGRGDRKRQRLAETVESYVQAACGGRWRVGRFGGVDDGRRQLKRQAAVWVVPGLDLPVRRTPRKGADAGRRRGRQACRQAACAPPQHSVPAQLLPTRLPRRFRAHLARCCRYGPSGSQSRSHAGTCRAVRLVSESRGSRPARRVPLMVSWRRDLARGKRGGAKQQSQIRPASGGTAEAGGPKAAAAAAAATQPARLTAAATPRAAAPAWGTTQSRRTRAAALPLPKDSSR